MIAGIITAISAVALFYWSNQKQTIADFVTGPRTLHSSFVNLPTLRKELGKTPGVPIQILNVAADSESEDFARELNDLLSSAGWNMENRGRLQFSGGAVTSRDITIIKPANKFSRATGSLLMVFKYLNYPVKILDENNNPFGKIIDQEKITLSVGYKY